MKHFKAILERTGLHTYFHVILNRDLLQQNN